MEKTGGRRPHSRVVLVGVAAVLLLSIALSGCTAPDGIPGVSADPVRAPVLVLDLHLRRAEEATPLMVASGGACTMAKLGDDEVRLERSMAHGLAPDQAIVVIVPHTEGAWDVLAGQPGFRALPARVEPMIDLRTHLLGVVDLDAGNGTALVDGAAVSLPYQWNVTDGEAGWNATLKLQRGPDQWRTFTQWFCQRDG